MKKILISLILLAGFTAKAGVLIEPYYDYIMSLKPRRIIFNPGTENDELMRMAAKDGIDTLEACTLVMLSTGQY